LKRIAPVFIACCIASLIQASENPPSPRTPPAAPDDALLDGLSAIHQGRFSYGKSRFRAFLEADPSDPRGHLFLAFSEWWKLLQLGETVDSENLNFHLLESVRVAQEQLNQSPGDAQALSSLGTAYIFLAQYRASQKKVFRAASAAKKGRGFLEKAVARDPELVDPRFGLGAYNYYSDKVNLLVKGLRTLLFLPGGDSEKGLNQLREVAERGHYFRTEAHLLLGIIFQNHHEHRYLEALGHFRSALALNPGSPIILGTIGEMEIRLGRYPDAQSTLRRCIEIAGRSEDPEQQELARMSRILLSDSLSLSLHSVEAMDELETALNGGEIQPVFRNRALTVATQAATRLGATQRLERIYRLLSVTEEERPRLQARFGAGPEEIRIFPTLRPALQEMERGKPVEARRRLEQIDSRFPNLPLVQLQLARTYFEQERWAEAEARLRRIPDETSGEAVAAWILGWRDLYLGRVLDAQGRKAEAREVYSRAATREGFRTRDLAKALLGPEGSARDLWPRQVFALGTNSF